MLFLLARIEASFVNQDLLTGRFIIHQYRVAGRAKIVHATGVAVSNTASFVAELMVASEDRRLARVVALTNLPFFRRTIATSVAGRIMNWRCCSVVMLAVVTASWS